MSGYNSTFIGTKPPQFNKPTFAKTAKNRSSNKRVVFANFCSYYQKP